MIPIDDTKDRQLIERIIDKHDYEPMDAKKLKKFIEEKRHKIKRTPKKPTKIADNNTNKMNKENKTEQITLNKTEPDMNFRFKSDDESEEEVKSKTPIKKSTKVNDKVKSDSDDESEEEVKSKTPINSSIKKPIKVKPVKNDESEEEVKSKTPINSSIKKPIKVKSDSDDESEEEVKSKTPLKKPTKVNDKVKSDSDDESEEEVKSKTSIKKSTTESEEEVKSKTPKNKQEKVNDKSESEEVLSKIQLLNQELFKENSNKSRNETIKKAWKSLSEYELPNKDNLIIKKSHPGHFVTMGCNAGSLKNPHWLVVDKNTNQEYYIMYCETDAYTKFSVEDYKEVINPIENKYPTWHIEKIGYIQTKNYITRTTVYLHQVICKKHNEKKYSTLSVDHKNRDKLDNRNHNLRFATQSEQNQNTDKRNRKYNAKKLPDGLKQEDMPKYVLYYSEMYGTNKDKFREWLNIEKHPKQNGKRWSTSKSMGISIQEKLEQAKAKLEELDL